MLAGKYKVERVLGEGGMGIVVAAMHEQLEQRVALKFLLPEIGKDGALVARFLREAKAAVRLRSEHVARVLDVGTLDTGSPYIVMEYLEGCDLATVLEREQRLSPAVAASYLLQACEALAEAHALGIVHRDLKPANLFLTTRSDGSPCVKVLDFGVSKVSQTNAAPQELTKTRTMMGTPQYMSPEQLRSSRSVDPRSDVWALGMILYELLTGVLAFRHTTLPELCAAILYEPPLPPRELDPSIPREIEAVILKALEKDLSRRYQSVGELAAALAPFTPRGEQAAQRIGTILLPPAERASRLPEARVRVSPHAETVGPQGPAVPVRASPQAETLDASAPQLQALVARPPAARQVDSPRRSPPPVDDATIAPEHFSSGYPPSSPRPSLPLSSSSNPWAVLSVVLGGVALFACLLALRPSDPAPPAGPPGQPDQPAAQPATQPPTPTAQPAQTSPQPSPQTSPQPSPQPAAPASEKAPEPQTQAAPAAPPSTAPAPSPPASKPRRKPQGASPQIPDFGDRR